MKPAFHLAGLGCALCVAPALGGEPIKPTTDLRDFRVVIIYVSTGELANLQSRYGGGQIDLRDVRQNHRHGFTIVSKNRETGGLTCEIYLPNSKRPQDVDDKATLTLGHELLHCMLGNYHR